MAQESTSRIKILKESDATASATSRARSEYATRKALESLDEFWNYRCDGEDEKKRLYNVVFPQSAYRTVVEHLAADKSREHGGFLLGYETQIGPAKTPTVVIEEAVPAKFTNGSPVRLTFTTDSWRSLDEHTDQLREGGRILQRVGWYHSHPNISIFLSHWDLDVCKTFDQRQYPIALVVDPVNDRGGFFVATNKVYQAHSPQGFYESPDLQREPVTNWRNMTPAAGPQDPGRGGKSSDKAIAVDPAGTGGQTRETTEARSAAPKIAIVLSVLALLISVGGFSVLLLKERDLARQLKGAQQDLLSLKGDGTNPPRTGDSIDALVANVMDLRAEVDKLKGPSAKLPGITVSVMPLRAELQASGKTVFHAKVSGTSTPDVRWEITPPHGTIQQKGEYQAPASIPKEEHVMVRAISVAEPGKSGTAVVTLRPSTPVTEPAGEVSVEVKPDRVTVIAGGKQTFTAKVTGVSEPGVQWSIEGDGSIHDGEYSAPGAVTEPSSVTVKASSTKDPTKYGTATITLNPAPQPTLPN